MTRFASIALQIAILLGLASPAVADDPQITLQVSATDIYADDVRCRICLKSAWQMHCT